MTYPVVFLAGPTAVGKSLLSFKLAKESQLSIVNADSIQMYTRLDIGSAKPSPDMRAAVPHYLLDVADPPKTLTAADFRKNALEILKSETPKRAVIVTGGSGFYLQALEKGLFPAPATSRKDRADLELEAKSQGLPHLYAELKKRDPEAAQSINPSDQFRVLRALSVLRTSHKKLSDIKKEFVPEPFPFRLIKVALTRKRAELEQQIAQRTDMQLKAGWLEEVEELLKEGYADWPPLKSVGYRECVQALRGEINVKDLADRIQISTRQLVKKQYTWFRRDPSWVWFDISEGTAQVEEFLRAEASGTNL